MLKFELFSSAWSRSNALIRKKLSKACQIQETFSYKSLLFLFGKSRQEKRTVRDCQAYRAFLYNLRFARRRKTTFPANLAQFAIRTTGVHVGTAVTIVV